MSSPERPSDVFDYNFKLWKVLGVWPGKKISLSYICYACVYLSLSLFLFSIFMYLDLFFTPRTIELLINQIRFIFTDITLSSKALILIYKHSEIVEIFNLMDDEILRTCDEKSEDIMRKFNTTYRAIFKFYTMFCVVSLFLLGCVPVFISLVFDTELELPVTKFYFLSKEVYDKYFWFWYIYQVYGMYVHTMYNVGADAFFTGLMLFIVNQIKIIEHQLFNLKLETSEKELSLEAQDQLQMIRLNKVLRRFDFLLAFCSGVQDIMSVAMFIQFAMTAVNLCVILCGLVLFSCTVEEGIGLIMYLSYIIIQIFVPSYLGTQLTNASSELVFAAYNSEWIPRSEGFKRSLRIFVSRANKPIEITGLSIFPMALSTFTAIMKSSYSFFTLVSSFQK